MSFTKMLQGIGDRLGILESAPGAETVPAGRIHTRTVTLRELASEIRSGEVRALADSPAEFSVPFEEIYKAAGIPSGPEDWTIDRLQQIVSEQSGKEKSRESVQKAVLGFLQSKGVAAEIIIKDAIARDQALDAFENRAGEKMQERNQACRKRILEIGEQMKDLQQERARIEAGLQTDEEKWREWRRQKRSKEREMASAAGYIVDRPVVTTDVDD